MLRIIIALSIIFLPNLLSAQVIPEEGSMLNYRLIGFSVPAENKAQVYIIEVAQGSHSTEQSFKKNVFKTISSNTNRVVIEAPLFGCQYTWRVIYSFDKSSITTSSLFHFSIGKIPEVDAAVSRLRITQAAKKYNDAYVFIDSKKAIFDMNGNAVWYLPDIEGKSILPIDLKLSAGATMTFLAKGEPYEINYRGGILWKAPEDCNNVNDGNIHFHHEFTKMTNGHYMVMGNEFIQCRMPGKDERNRRIVLERMVNDGPPAPGTEPGPKLMFGTLAEYDPKGNLIWSWRSSKYFEESDLANYESPGRIPVIDLHENSFYFDEINKVIYVSFKNISRIVKIKYPEGAILYSYGEECKPGQPIPMNSLFCGQHSVRYSRNGYLLLFNNNQCNPGLRPSIEILHEPEAGGNYLKKIWEYPFSDDIKTADGFPSGGNVMELTDNSFFVSTAAPDGKVFIVDRNKEILWSAVPEKWNEQEKKWAPSVQYRASIIESRQDMERLIWGE